MALMSLSDRYEVELLTASVIDPNAVPMRLWPCLRNSAMSSFDQVPRPVRWSPRRLGAYQASSCAPARYFGLLSSSDFSWIPMPRGVWQGPQRAGARTKKAARIHSG